MKLFRSWGEVGDWLELHGVPAPNHPVLDLTKQLLASSGATHTPPWESFLGQSLWDLERAARQDLLKESFKGVWDRNQDTNEEATRWWTEIYHPTQDRLFSQLRAIGVRRDFARALIALEQNPAQRTLLGKFLETEIPVYTRTSSRTGRLSVRSGPDLTLLRREHRGKILQSRWSKDGSLWSLDFNALEPRVLLALRTRLLGLKNLWEPSPEDLYTQVRDLYVAAGRGEAPGDRARFKQATLSLLYGAKTDRTLGEFLDQTFCVQTLQLFLENRVNTLFSGQKLTNYYGRPIWLHESTPGHLVNYLVQSTAVDVALMGFGNVVEEGGRSKGGVVPTFVIHDALWLDVHKDVEGVIPRLCEVGSVGIPGMLGATFPVKATKLS